jgi:hypothetical protein
MQQIINEKAFDDCRSLIRRVVLNEKNGTLVKQIESELIALYSSLTVENAQETYTTVKHLLHDVCIIYEPPRHMKQCTLVDVVNFTDEDAIGGVNTHEISETICVVGAATVIVGLLTMAIVEDSDTKGLETCALVTILGGAIAVIIGRFLIR